MSGLFAGKFIHTLDAKGRIIVPAKFKKNLGDTFVLSLGLDGCLYIFPNDQWENFIKELDDLPGTDKKVRTIRRAFMSLSADCEIDKQGRVLIPTELRTKAKITKEAVFVGVGHKIELWDKKQYEEANDFDSIEDLAEDLTAYGISF